MIEKKIFTEVLFLKGKERQSIMRKVKYRKKNRYNEFLSAAKIKLHKFIDYMFKNCTVE